MISFIEKHDLLYNAQYGFRKLYSTEHAILDIVNAVQSNMNNRMFFCGIFIDLKKAFDTVDHSILLQKLYHYGFRGIINDWCHSYLTDRFQATEIQNHISRKTSTDHGVPQGSVLGPLLFLLYMNDIHFASDKLSFYLFADDTNMLYSDKILASLERVVNLELHKVPDWLTSNRLTLNVLKSNYVIFRPYQKTLSHPVQIMMYDNEKHCSADLESKQYVKYLGLLIDSSLTWKNHIDQIALKVSKTVGLLAKLGHFVPRITLINIYKSLILPHVSYGLTAWGMASECYINKILILQKRAVRFINFSHFKEHAVPLFIEADSLPVDFLHYEAFCCRMYDIQNGIAPKNILDLFTHTSSIHTYRTPSTYI